MREVQIDPMPLDRLAGLLDAERAATLTTQADKARRFLQGRTVWNLNATATGGGVAEMLQTLLAYSRGAGVDARWLVLDGEPEFFRFTKRLHNVLHGSPGDGGPVDESQRPSYERVLEANTADLIGRLGDGDLVLLHDPQTAGMVQPLVDAGAHVVWRCHIGRDDTTELTDRGWAFLQPYVAAAHAVIFSRAAYVPGWLDTQRLRIIPPSLDPFSAKNADLAPEAVRAALACAGLVAGSVDAAEKDLRFVRRDGSTGTVRRHADLVVAGDPLPADARLVMQVSRWDRLKDMAGVLEGFVGALPELPEDAHLALVGPEVSGVSDDPEGAEVLQECQERFEQLDADARRRVHLVALPMDDIDENAHLVNALQRHADVVAQKSLVEGFGLTVTEPMWKAKPVVASAVGGIQDQIIDGESGVLLPDPEDLAAFGASLAPLLGDEDHARRLGEAARERVRDRFLGDRHLIQYVQLFAELLT